VSTLDLPTDTRSRPCPTCPYRRDAPSGLWARHEYAKLPAYDGTIVDQATVGAARPFMCHSTPRSLCAGWVGHRDPTELLAVRLGISGGRIDPSTADYTTDVPLFATGAEAAAHGMADIAEPGPAARAAITKVVRARKASDYPVELG
jgi:hypothetical protein